MVGSKYRSFAAAIALIGLASLAVAFFNEREPGQSILSTLWRMADYLTQVNTVVVVAVFAAGAALGSAILQPRLVGAVALNALFVAIGYLVLINPTQHFESPLDGAANIVSHGVLPLMVLSFWIWATPGGRLRAWDPIVWSLYPLSYLAYALLRAVSEHSVPYDVINIEVLGYSAVTTHVVALIAAFLILGEIMVLVDSRRPSTHGPSPSGSERC